ncbi:unnamed protein product [Brassicogethes aeneus]|uniref:Endonuclease-reverse transcriptase n=1 Tax=Brassicogethes aeneus TaxID=1431903 RepID=A0A9P0BD37_BRAAE|nr:unnamed protein product [Brassicogethes aeneus]
MSFTNEDIYNLIKEENKLLRSELCKVKLEIKNEIDILKNKNIELEQQVTNLQNKIRQIEKKQKKFNIIVYGLPGEEKETSANFFKLLDDCFSIGCSSKDIRDIYRIGKNTGNPQKPRPVLLELISYSLKVEILKKAADKIETLKTKNISLTPDFESEEYQQRKLLYKYSKEARDKGLSTKILKGKIIIDKKEYSYEELLAKEKKTNSAIEGPSLPEVVEKPKFNTTGTVTLRSRNVKK